MPPFFSSSSQLHIHISAQDRPGILAEALAFIVQTGWNVVDIKQFVFNGLLNLSILLDGCDDHRILPLREALSAYAEKMDFKVTVYPWETATRPDAPYAHRSVVTLLCDSIPSSGFRKLPGFLPNSISTFCVSNNWIREMSIPWSLL